MRVALKLANFFTFYNKKIQVNSLPLINHSYRKFHLAGKSLSEKTIIDGLNEFITERNNYKARFNLLDAKKKFNQPIPLEAEPRKKYRRDFVELIFSIKREHETELPFQIIRKNKYKLIELNEKRYAIYYSKLLFVLNQTDKLAEIIESQDIGVLFKNITCKGILLVAYIDEKRYSEAVDFFIKFLAEYVKTGNHVNMINDHIGHFARTIYIMNSIESMQALESVIQILIDNDFNFLNFIIHNYMCMLCIRQNRPDIAKEILRRTNHPIALNFSVIINSQLDKINEAFEDLELIIDSEDSKWRRIIFQESLNALNNAIEKKDSKTRKRDSSDRKRFITLVSRISEMQLLSPLNLDEQIDIERFKLLKRSKATVK